jgi:hypothetical protein
MQKKSLVLICCIVVVCIAIVLLVVYLAKGGSTDLKDIANSNSNGKSNSYVDSGDITWSIDPEDTTDESVTIYIEANSSLAKNVVSITLPNNQLVTTSNTKYEVTKNGDYTFIFNKKNGDKISKVVTISNINSISADSPYIPSGFSHVEGTEVSTGYVIEDENGNQFVWVPVSSGVLTRNTDGNELYEESDYTATSLYNSVAKYYGFYIARYEASKDNVNGLEIAKSVEGQIPWSNVNYEDAYSAALNTATAYDYIGVKTALMNSYAWDTTLKWINQTITNYASNTSYGNYSGTILVTGNTINDKVNEIYDLSGNLREWTTEIYNEPVQTTETEETSSNKNNNLLEDAEDEVVYGYRVVRGGSAIINKVANSHIAQLENLSDPYWGFRMILYKD